MVEKESMGGARKESSKAERWVLHAASLKPVAGEIATEIFKEVYAIR
jgi:hypothetical protein